MPFAATSNYNWLFDVPSLDDAFGHIDVPLAVDLMSFADRTSDIWSQSVHQSENQNIPHHEEQQPSITDFPGATRLRALTSSTSHYALALGDAPLRQGVQSHGTSVSVSSEPQSGFSLPPSSRYPTMDTQVTVPNWMNHDTQHPTEAASRLPQVGATARAGILCLISQFQPLTVGGSLVDPSSHLPSISSLQLFCDLFFTRFNKAYPSIHQPTFHPDRVDRLFLAAVLSMGATYSTKEAHQLAVGIHDSLRVHLFSHPDFSPQPELWVLQTSLLIDCFGKQRAGHKQRELAQLFHRVLIKLIRRSDCLMIRTAPTVQRPNDLESAWKQAMGAEARKRLAMLCFMWDTQHAVLISQSLCMSAFEIRSSLPCDPATWEAATAEDWFEHSRREQPHGLFLSTLKA
ncbi:hypothetical protein VTO42DRAFT_645 [Malbranchea cinnamomea]